jgi:hypothetical protein
LLGISSASGSCSFIGTTVGTTYDLHYLFRVTAPSNSTSYEGTLRLTIDSITPTSNASVCTVGISGSITGGNLSSMPGFSSSYSHLNTTVPNITHLPPSSTPFIISMSVTNKSIYYNPGGSGTAASWDINGVVDWMFMYTSSGGMYVLYSITREAALLPGYEMWALLLAGGIGIASVIGIALKKHH